MTSQDEDPEDSTPDTSGSCNEESEPPCPQIHRQGSKKRSSVFPKESKIKRLEACARIQEALDQVPYSVHLNSRGDRDTATLCVGNIDYNASEQDLSKALDKIFQRIRVEKVTIPRVNGRSMYGFIYPWKRVRAKPTGIWLAGSSQKLPAIQNYRVLNDINLKLYNILQCFVIF
jgi:hypothetical protein